MPITTYSPGLTTPPVYPAGHPLHRRNAQEVPVDDAVTTAQHWVPQLRAAADVVVVVSHLGLRRDVELAATVPGIDLIIGGHSHHRLPTLLPIGRTTIAQAGIGGAYLGVITVTSAVGTGTELRVELPDRSGIESERRR